MKQNHKDRIKSKQQMDASFAYKMVAPMSILFLAIGLFPILYSFVLSFLNWKTNINRPIEFIGLTNYIKAFSDIVFLESLSKTAYMVVIVLVGSVVLGFLYATLVNSPCVKKKELFVLVSLFPWAIPKVVGGLMWAWIYNGNYGILNVIMKNLGLIEKFQWWFNKPVWFALFMCAIVEIWRLTPFAGLLFFAGYQNIPKQLYQAAELDGANKFQLFRHVTFPGIRVVLMSVLIVLTTWSLKTFDTVYVLTTGGPGNNTMISYIYIFLQAFNYQNISYASALGYLFTTIILILIVIYYRSFGKDNT